MGIKLRTEISDEINILGNVEIMRHVFIFEFISSNL